MTYKDLIHLALDLDNLDDEVVVCLGENSFAVIEAMGYGAEYTKKRAWKKGQHHPILELNDEALEKFVSEIKSGVIVDG